MEKEIIKEFSKSFHLKYYAIATLALWSLAIVISLVWNLTVIKSSIHESARIQATPLIESDIVYREWNSKLGGVYAKVSDQIQPNPYLKVLDRDVITTSGQKLTLVNPAFMTRHVHEISKSKTGIKSHITSLKPVNPKNAPDPWEKNALKQIENGETKVSRVHEVNGEEFIRLILPLKVTESCLQCHADQGYKTGDIRGGISVTIPLASYDEIKFGNRVATILGHGFIWIFGLAGIGFAMARFAVHIKVHEHVEKSLETARDQADEKVKQRTSELERLNRDLKVQVEKHEILEGHLIESKTRLQSVFDGISEPLIMMDQALTVKMLNKAAAAYYNVKIKNIVGRTCTSAFSLCNDLCDDCPIPFLVKKDETHFYERKGFMDSQKDETVTIYPIRNNENQLEASLIRISDITESKKIQEKLMQNEKLASLGFLISGIAHEINNPNNFITFNIPILKDYINEIIPFADEYSKNQNDFEVLNMSYPEFRKDIFTLLVNIEHGSQRISKIVSELRGFVREKKSIQFQRVDIKEVIERSTLMCKGKINTMVKTFKTDITEGLPKAMSDPEIMEQILINIIINAAQSVDKDDSRIEIHAFSPDQDKRTIHIEIIDNGKGMDKEIQKKIFEPFFTTKDPGVGTGLGLAVCQSLLEALGCEIQVESIPGQGSTFRIILPINP